MYSELLLSTGGGIISQTQQADQVGDTATVLIGLGGTGVNCIKQIKRAVYDRLKPDVGSELPEYRHIQFLGIDTDNTVVENSSDRSHLNSQTEFLDISVNHLTGAMVKAFAEQVHMNPQLNWLNSDIALSATLPGAGGVRQAGRLMLMEHAEEVTNKITNLLNEAKANLPNPANQTVNIHIFAGLGGGTGSGTFLDVCYLAKELSQSNNGMVYGYFFLPDVNLSKLDLGNDLARTAIMQNGYAAMQELDHCMGLGRNDGKTFDQLYKGGKVISWNKPPVDMCHLITATDMNGAFIPNAYQNAMNVVTEYILDFLTKPNNDQIFGIRAHQSNFENTVRMAEAQRNIGSELRYCVIGGACATIPMKEINTYLASGIFAKIAELKERRPGSGDVETLVETVGLKYDNIEREVQNNLYSDFSPFPDSWRDVRGAGLSAIQLVTDYFQKERAERYNGLRKNAEMMQDAKNQNALISRIRRQLDNYAAEYGKGPVFAYGMLEAARSENLLNVIAGLKRQNESNLNQAAYEQGQARTRYDAAVTAYRSKQKKETFMNMEGEARAFVTSEFKHERYEEIGTILDTLEKQVGQAASQYYIILNRVFCELVDTFEENRNNLSSGSVTTIQNEFAKPIVTIQDENLQRVLKERIEAVDQRGFMTALIQTLQANPEEWIEEKEFNITRLINQFMINLFGDFAGKTITDFLAIKYDTDHPATITARLEEEEIQPLNGKAAPLFQKNNFIWNNALDMIQFISVPASAAVVVQAAQNVFTQQNELKQSALTDRIYVMKVGAVLPLASYYNCAEYEKVYYETMKNGCHYYEGMHDTPDWRNLAPITPVSKIEVNQFTPQKMKENLQASAEMYEIAQTKDLLQGDDIYAYSEASKENVKEKMANMRTRLDALEERKNDPKALAAASAALDDLKRAVEKMSVMPTGYKLKHGASAPTEIIESIRKDFFYKAFEIQNAMRADVELVKEAEKLLGYAEDAIQQITSKDAKLKEFGQALFSGVFKVEGLKIVYEKVEYGIPEEYVLNKIGPDFPYSNIPLYQAYRSYLDFSEETRKNIREETERRLNAGDMRITEAAEKLKGMITDEYNGKMAANARTHITEYQEIVDFIRKFTIEMHALINLFGL